MAPPEAAAILVWSGDTAIEVAGWRNRPSRSVFPVCRSITCQRSAAVNRSRAAPVSRADTTTAVSAPGPKSARPIRRSGSETGSVRSLRVSASSRTSPLGLPARTLAPSELKAGWPHGEPAACDLLPGTPVDEPQPALGVTE